MPFLIPVVPPGLPVSANLFAENACAHVTAVIRRDERCNASAQLSLVLAACLLTAVAIFSLLAWSSPQHPYEVIFLQINWTASCACQFGEVALDLALHFTANYVFIVCQLLFVIVVLFCSLLQYKQ